MGQRPGRTLHVVLGLSMLIIQGCIVGVASKGDPEDAPQFGNREDRGLVAYDPITEASGLVTSRRNSGVIWTHNDSGDQARIYAMDFFGNHLGVYRIDNAAARDWEDIAIGPGPETGIDYLYIGDIGDNQLVNDQKYIYRIAEPVVRSDQQPVDGSIADVERITVVYPGGNRDAESLLVDPLNGDLYILSKGASLVRVFRAQAPLSTSTTITMDELNPIQLDTILGFPQNAQGAVAGDISSTGLEILVKTYRRVYYWGRSSGDEPLFTGKTVVLPYDAEPQGEAIGWAPDGSGYYTVSEELGQPARLYFYPRID